MLLEPGLARLCDYSLLSLWLFMDMAYKFMAKVLCKLGLAHLYSYDPYIGMPVWPYMLVAWIVMAEVLSNSVSLVSGCVIMARIVVDIIVVALHDIYKFDLCIHGLCSCENLAVIVLLHVTVHDFFCFLSIRTLALFAVAIYAIFT